MGYNADTEKGATRTGIMSVLFIIEEVGDCWKVRSCGESETDLLQPPMMNMSKSSALLMTKTMVHQVGEVSSGPGPMPPMHQAFRLNTANSRVHRLLTFDTRGLFFDSMGIFAHGAMSMIRVHSRCRDKSSTCLLSRRPSSTR